MQTHPAPATPECPLCGGENIDDAGFCLTCKELVCVAEAIVAEQIAAAAGSSRGTNLHGWATSERRIQTVDEVLAGLIEKAARSAAFALTPECRFMRAAQLIDEATGDERLIQCWRNGLSTNHERASRLLSEMSGPAADDARSALAEFTQSQQKAA